MEKRTKTVEVWVTDDGVEHPTKHAAEMHEERANEAKELTIQQQRNADTQYENEQRVAAARMRFEEHPDELDLFIRSLKVQHDAFMQRGVRKGWWKDVKPNGDPIPHPRIIKISDLGENETLMAHVVHNHLGLFESVNQAKKNGWGKPVQAGDYWLNKKTLHLRIVDE